MGVDICSLSAPSIQKEIASNSAESHKYFQASEKCHITLFTSHEDEAVNSFARAGYPEDVLVLHLDGSPL